MEIDDILEEDLLSIFNASRLNSGGEKQKSRATEEKEFKEDPFEVDFDDTIKMQPSIKSEMKVLEIDSNNVDSFALLLKELLQNKTIEISIKVKEN